MDNSCKEILPKGWKFREDARALSEDTIAEHDVAVKQFEGPDPVEYCPRGFAVFNVDARGAGDSDGSIVIMGKQEGEDGHDVIEDLAKMDWCNGSLGLAENSHLGIVQREQFVRGGAWDDGLFDFIIEHVIRGKRGVEDFKEMYRRSNAIDIYWEDKRAEIEEMKIPTYVVASYSSFVHTMGSIRGYMHFDLWSVKKSVNELAEFFDHFLKGKDNNWQETPKVRMASLPLGDNKPSIPSSFNLRFDKKTRLMGLPKAVFYMSCDDLDDMVVYVLIRKLDKNGKAMIAISIPWENCPYPNTASIPESDYSNPMIYFGPTGVLRASHLARPILQERYTPNIPSTPTTKCKKSLPAPSWS
ncbi:alpha/beta-hydrolase, partial [Aureobasidium melanogenum]